jgi:hypothetical protein
MIEVVSVYHSRGWWGRSRSQLRNQDNVWSNQLKPQLAQIAQPLLSSVTQRLEEIHHVMAGLGTASRELDLFSHKRLAIEPHQQYGERNSVDILVDVARDALEWLAEDSAKLLGSWIEMLVTSDAPLLRRLAIHSITLNPQLSPSDCLYLVLDRIGLHGSEFNEVLRVVTRSYGGADEQARKAVVDAILAYMLPDSEHYSDKERTARWHFDWLSWLLESKPDCVLANAALSPIKAKFPEWCPSASPAHSFSIEWEEIDFSKSPFSVEQLLAKEPQRQLDDLLTFTGNRLNGPCREGLLESVREACRERTNWALSLGKALAVQALWSSDLWPQWARGLQESELSVEAWHDLLALISSPSLQSVHACDIANLLHSLVRDGGKPFAIDLLDNVNTIALSMWQLLELDIYDETIGRLLFRSLNCPAGVIVQTWIKSLSLLVKRETAVRRALPEQYSSCFTLIVEDPTPKGGIGRCVLASQTAFLFGLDEEWTLQHIIPLFSDQNEQKFNQAWSGFLMSGGLCPALIDRMQPAFIAAVPRISHDAKELRESFIEHYTALTVYIADPKLELLPQLFQQGSQADRLVFASTLGSFLRKIPQSNKQQLWRDWLRQYWEDRLQGILAPLNEFEVFKMLEWLPHLGDVFPEAVALAIRSPAITITDVYALRELRQSKLVQEFPHETAKLLIYFSSCNIEYFTDELECIQADLPPISPEITKELMEAFVLAGLRFTSS